MISLLAIIAISCVTMVIKDAVATFLVVAEARGRAHLAGLLNALGTPVSVIFFSAYGATALVHGHGWLGWLGLLPIMCCDYIDGSVFTALASKMKGDISATHHFHGGVLGAGWHRHHTGDDSQNRTGAAILDGRAEPEN